MSNLPADWAIEKALCEVGELLITVEEVREAAAHGCYLSAIVKLARYIEAHKKPPVDRKLRCARAAAAERYPIARREIEEGEWDEDGIIIDLMEALTKYEEGFGKDPETTVPQCQ